jgi:hypothetical protein
MVLRENLRDQHADLYLLIRGGEFTVFYLTLIAATHRRKHKACSYDQWQQQQKQFFHDHIEYSFLLIANTPFTSPVRYKRGENGNGLRQFFGCNKITGNFKMCSFSSINNKVLRVSSLLKKRQLYGIGGPWG